MKLNNNNLYEGVFLREAKNRFICQVCIGEKIVECYLPNSARMANFINLKNKNVLLLENMGKDTRTKYSLFAVKHYNKYIILNLNIVNKLFIMNARKGIYDNYDLNGNFLGEARIDDYKADVVYEGNEKIIIENKAIISTNKNAYFPSVYSRRAIEQLKKIYVLLEKGKRIHYNYISLSPYIKTIKINEEQEDYYKQFIKCIRKGMKVYGYSIYYKNGEICNGYVSVIINM